MCVICPLCDRTSFDSINALQISLIKAANCPLPCPICNELFLGLDKLTIHLFSHTAIIDNTNNVSSTNSICISDSNRDKKVDDYSKQITDKSKNENERRMYEEKNEIIYSLQQTQHKQPFAAVTKPHNQENIAVCDICECSFRDVKLRDLHFKLFHKTIHSLNSTKKLTNNQSGCTSIINDGFMCHLCEKTFKLKASLRIHLKVVHYVGVHDNDSSSKLSICDRIRNRQTDVRKCLNDTNSTYQETLPMENTNLNNSERVIALNLNSKSLTSNVLPITSGKDIHNLIPIDINKSVSSLMDDSTMCASNLASKIFVVINTNVASEDLNAVKNNNLGKNITNTLLADQTKIWQCDVCTKSFTTKYFLKKHKRLHTGEMPYTCEICARSFTFQQSYHKHLLYHNSSHKPHVCITCGRAFKELSTLHNHERIHSGEKPFRCDFCGKSFRQRVSFLVHTRIHTGVMPYKCTICEKSFRYKVSQRTHKCLPKTITTLNSSTSVNNKKDDIDLMSENFIKAFLENTAPDLTTSSSGCLEKMQNKNNTVISDEHLQDKNGAIHEALLVKVIDDIVVDSCNKMGIINTLNENECNTKSTFEHIPVIAPNFSVLNYQEVKYNDGSKSPSLKMQAMSLYSTQLISDHEEAVNGDHITNFFIDNQ